MSTQVQKKKFPNTRWGRNSAKHDNKKRLAAPTSNEIKNPEQIVRQRLRLEHIRNKEKTNRFRKNDNRKRHAKKIKNKGK